MWPDTILIPREEGFCALAFILLAGNMLSSEDREVFFEAARELNPQFSIEQLKQNHCIHYCADAAA